MSLRVSTTFPTKETRTSRLDITFQIHTLKENRSIKSSVFYLDDWYTRIDCFGSHWFKWVMHVCVRACLCEYLSVCLPVCFDLLFNAFGNASTFSHHKCQQHQLNKEIVLWQLLRVMGTDFDFGTHDKEANCSFRHSVSSHQHPFSIVILSMGTHISSRSV